MNIWILTLFIGSVIAAPSLKVHHRQTRNVASLIEDILEKTGIKDLLPWVKEKIQTDPDVKKFIDYLESGKFQQIIDDLHACPGYDKVKQDLAKEGVDIVKIIQDIRNFVTGKSYYKKIQPRQNLGDIFNEFLSKLDLNRVIEVIMDKINNDPDMKKVIDYVQTDVVKGLVECMKKSDAVQELKEKLYDEGIDIESLIEMIKMLTGNGGYYHIQPRTVGELLERLITRLGLRDLLPWIREKIETDPDAQRVVEYLKSPAFKRIEEALKACPGYQETKEELLKEGVDLVKILDDIRNFLSGGAYHAKTAFRHKRNLGDLFQEILEKLDIDRMLEIIRTEFHGDPDLKKVVDFLKGPVHKGIVECMKKNKDVQDLVQKLNDEGVDVAGIMELIDSILEEQYYYKIQPRTVGELLEKLITRLGLRDLLPWIREKIETDPDAQRVVEYLKGPAFKRIEEALKACPGYQETKEELLKEGVDLVKILEDVRNFLSGGAYHAKTAFRHKRNLGDLFREILEKLDIDRMLEIIRTEFHGDPDLKKVVDFLKGPVHKGIVECMKKNKDVQELVQTLNDEGVDVAGIMELIDSILEEQYYYKIQPRTVGELLEKLITRLGLRDLLPWIREKIETDPDAQRVVEYLKSDAFKRIEDALRKCPGYQETKEQLLKEGVDLVKILDDIRNFITGGSVKIAFRHKRTIGDFVQEIIDKLDIDRMIEIIRTEFHDDPDMKKVIAFLKGPVNKGIIDCMGKNKDVQDLIAKLNNEGVDVAGIVELIESLLESA